MSELLVDSLGSALRSGEHGLSTAPALLRRVLEEGSWREFVTKRGEHVVNDRWNDFVTKPPLAGLGATADLVDRIVGRDDPDLLRLLKTAKAVGRGSAGRGRPSLGRDDSTSPNGGATEFAADRLARDAPDEYAAVQRGEKTINRAAVDAGIRKRRVSLNLADPESAARTLHNNASPEYLAALRQLLTEDES